MNFEISKIYTIEIEADDMNEAIRMCADKEISFVDVIPSLSIRVSQD